MALVYGNIILLLCVIIELLYVHYYRKDPIDMLEVTANINSGHILLFIFRSLGLTVYFYVWNQFNSGLILQWPTWGVWCFAILLWDFCYYWSHRFHHYFSALWYVHQVHHEGEHFNLSLGLRNSWYSTLTSLPFFLIMALIGVPLEVFMPVSAFHYFIQFLNHSQLVRKIPWVEKIFITPSDHRVHHGKNEPYLNKNFGGTFVIWDKIFHTFQSEKLESPIEYGVPNRIKTANALLINNSHFLGRFFTSREVTDKKNIYNAPTNLIVTGCLILFGLLLLYLFKERDMEGMEKFLLFTIIFLGTIANGGLSDSKKWALFLSFFNNVLLSSVYLVYFHHSMKVQFILVSLLMLHSLILVFDYNLSHRKNMSTS